MRKPRLLDLFCGAGGASMGYYRAGFEVVGVDIAPQKHYPFEFHEADALTYPLEGFDAIHASPPCQDYSASAVMPHVELGYVAKVYPRLVAPMLERLRASGLPWILENVNGSESEMQNPLTLCGTTFGLKVRRHRLFESSEMIFGAGPCRHSSVGDIVVFGAGAEILGTRRASYLDKYGHTRYRRKNCRKAEADCAMGIHWMTFHELCESIPPAYTEWLGRQLFDVVINQMEAA